MLQLTFAAGSTAQTCTWLCFGAQDVDSIHSYLWRLDAINMALELLSGCISFYICAQAYLLEAYKLLCLLVSGSSLAPTLAWVLPSLAMSFLKATR